jgi:hypothetical protein
MISMKLIVLFFNFFDILLPPQKNFIHANFIHANFYLYLIVLLVFLLLQIVVSIT